MAERNKNLGHLWSWLTNFNLKNWSFFIANRGYEACSNIAHIEQKKRNYLIHTREKQRILSGLKLPDTPELNVIFSKLLPKTVSTESLRGITGFAAKFVSTMSGMSETQAMWCISSSSAWSTLQSKRACTGL